jgi:aspartyl-tRNA(Asn)/glutamyl-tRNA(Gln) amidotransferase subunit A
VKSVRDTARDVQNGEASALSVVEESLAQIRARNEELHVFLYVDEEGARSAANALDERIARGENIGPLAGVPVALKDNLCQTGIPTTCSSKILEGWRPPYTATVVERLLAAGAVPVGKTNLDEFAMGSSTENSAFGPTRNPLCPSRVPGGSSGGSAAAVAADMAPLALGSDTGGSIRQPAALCGLIGVKPTYGLVSRYGLIAFASSLDQIGPLTKTVTDAAMALEAIAGHDPLDSTSLPEPSPSLVSHVEDGVVGKRIGVVRELIDGADEDVVASVERAVEVLRDAGATIVELSVPEFRLGLSAYYLIAPAEASSNLARFDGVRYGLRVDAGDVTAMMEATRTAGFGEEVKRRIMLGTYALSAGYYDAYYGQALKVRTLTIDAFRRAYHEADLLLGATTPSVAFEFGTKTADPMAMYLSDVFTIPSNLSGEPAISVPFGTGEAGLPVGVQLLGPGRSEGQLFAGARVLEIADGRP